MAALSYQTMSVNEKRAQQLIGHYYIVKYARTPIVRTPMPAVGTSVLVDDYDAGDNSFGIVFGSSKGYRHARLPFATLLGMIDVSAPLPPPR